MKPLDEMISKLPPEYQQEVEDFVEFIFQKHVKKPRKILKLTWAGVLEDIKDKYTSVELQHKISEWRIGEK
ncbi:MAG: XRE family transcriptional regulator [Candidatus Brocadia sapporoensis]|nr:MAG: XRE family transcriptional regulator [Candidatus Brocadia sapporoensis]